MKKILFTKYFPKAELYNCLGEKYCIHTEDFINIEPKSWNDIKQGIDIRTSNYILSSIRSASLIKNLNGFPIFYVVGEKSEAHLKESGYYVAFMAEYATDLVKFIKENIKEKTTFNFFCSQIRRDTIPNGLRNLGHEVNEIICYHTNNRSVEIDSNYDAYVFYSPSGVKSFQLQYKIPEKARIFAIGKTTADAVFDQLGKKAYYPEVPDQKSLLKFIKTKLNAEK